MYNDEEAKERLVALLGKEKIDLLESSHVAVVGLGGVGGSCAVALARGRVGSLTVIDGDKVESSNINRQAVAYVDTVGMRKTDAFEKLVRQINPTITLNTIDEFLLPATMEKTLENLKGVDFICDCIDSLKQKALLAKWAQENNIPIVSAMGAAKHLNPTAYRFADIYDTKICPVAKVIRKECRKLDVNSLDVLYSEETPKQESTQPVLGSISYMPPILGEMLAGYAMCKILNLPW